MLQLASGALGILSGTRRDPLGYDVRLELFGTADSVAVGVDGRTPLRSLEPGAPPPAEPGYRDFLDRFAPAYRAELAAFVDAVRTGGESPCSLDKARAALRGRARRRPLARRAPAGRDRRGGWRRRPPAS